MTWSAVKPMLRSRSSGTSLVLNPATLLSCMILIAMTATASTGQNVSPTDYTVPVSTAEQLRFDGSYKYAGQEDKVLTHDATGSVLYNRFYNSLPFAYDINLNAIADTKRRPDGEQDNSFNAILSGGVRKYFKPEGDFFYSLEAAVVHQEGFDRPSISATPGVGYGRFIRATDLAKAVRIEDFLMKEQVIRGRLPKETLIELAHIIEKEHEFKTEHGERYRRYWFEAMESEIAKTGLFVEEGLGAVGALRTEEVLFEERINERFYGWDARFGVRFELLSEFEDVDADDPAASFRFRYARPVGWKSQLGFSAEVNTPFTGDFADVYNATGTVDYIYEIGNRVDLTVSNVVLASRSNPDEDVVWSEQLRAGFIYYLENELNLIVTGNVRKDSDTPVTQGIDIAFGYRVK